MTDSWKTVSLGDVLTFQRGFDITKQEQCDGPYPVISSSGPKSSHAEFRARGPGVIIGRKGSLGTVFYSKTDYWPHDTTLWVKDFHGNDPRFAYYFLKTMGFERLDVGASNPSLNRNHIHSIQVRWPPLPIQRRIAGILSAYDDLIENNLRRIKILEEMARLLYREWFVHFRFPGHEKVRFIGSPLGKIPDGWAVRKLRDVCRLTMGQSPQSEFYNEEGEGLPFHQGVKDFGDRFPTNRLFCTASGRIAEPGDILFSVRAPVGRMNIADKRIVIGRGLSAIRHNADQQPFLWEQLRNRFVEEDMIGGGSIFAAVTKEDMLGIDLICPPESLVRQAQAALVPLHAETGVSIQVIHKLHQTRDLLLPRLLSGDIELPTVSFLPANFESDDRVPAESTACESVSGGVVQTTDHDEGPEQRQTVPPIDQTVRAEVLAIIRKIFSDGLCGNREEAIRAIAREIGYHRAGHRIQDVLDDDLRTAVRRGILDNDNGQLRLFTRSIADYDRDFLKKQFVAAIDRGWIRRDEAIQTFARWLGFRRTGPVIDETARSLINGLIREGRLETEGSELIRRVSV
jgi:type I restriction enzyme, S subunit